MAARPAAKKVGRKPPTWVWLAGGAVLAVAVYLIVKRRGGSSSLDTSGTPGPDLTGSAAQQPSGGASTVPGNLPPLLVSQPDPVTGQVVSTDASSQDTPTMFAPPASSGYLGTATPYAPMPGTFAAETSTPIYQAQSVNRSGLVTPSGGVPGLVDATGHVVNAKGARVGGRTLDT